MPYTRLNQFGEPNCEHSITLSKKQRKRMQKINAGHGKGNSRKRLHKGRPESQRGTSRCMSASLTKSAIKKAKEARKPVSIY